MWSLSLLAAAAAAPGETTWGFSLLADRREAIEHVVTMDDRSENPMSYTSDCLENHQAFERQQSVRLLSSRWQTTLGGLFMAECMCSPKPEVFTLWPFAKTWLTPGLQHGLYYQSAWV